MKLNYKIQLWITSFFRKYGKYIGIALTIWLIGFLINGYLKKLPKKLTLSSSYTPNVAIMTDNTVPKSQEKSINETLRAYTDSLISGDYAKAYNLLTEECKSFNYDNNIENFKQRTATIYNKDKVATFQAYSNYRKRYIYKVTVSDNIEKTGTSGNYKTYNELLTVSKVGKDYRIADYGYIDKEKVDFKNQDENIAVEIASKEVSYKTEQYNIKITNKTDKYIIIADSTAGAEITLNVGGEERHSINTDSQGIVLYPGETTTRAVVFYKYFDKPINASKMSFNVVRIVNTYNGSERNSSQKASKVYSFNINLKK